MDETVQLRAGHQNGSEIALDLLVEVFHRSPDGLIIGHRDGRISYANPAACQMFAMTEDQLRRRGRQGLSEPDDPVWRTALEERDRKGWARGVLPMYRADGSEFMAELSSALFRIDGDDGELASCVILRDVTERVRLERRSAALNDVVHALLVGADPAEVLALVAHHARIIFDATDAAVVTPAEPPDDVELSAAEGPQMSQLLGRRFPGGTVARQVIDSGDPVLIEDLSFQAVSEEGRKLGLGPAMVAPIVSGREVFGILFVGGDASRRPYTLEDLGLITTYAERAGLALAIGQARAESERYHRRLAEQLQQALESRIVIEQAKGVISAVRSTTPADAFKLIRAYARSHSQDIHDVSRAIVERRLLL